MYCSGSAAAHAKALKERAKIVFSRCFGAVIACWKKIQHLVSNKADFRLTTDFLQKKEAHFDENALLVL